MVKTFCVNLVTKKLHEQVKILLQDLDIKAKNSTIMLYMQNESKYDQLLLNKNEEIDLFKKQLKKQKLSKRVIITIGVVSLLFGVYKTL